MQEHMDLIDTHQHLIYRDRFGYDWTRDIPALAQGDFTLDDYRVLTSGRGVAGAVFMEAGVNDADYKAEARFIADLVRTGAVLGQIASCRPEEDRGFESWLEECSGLGVVGFRRILHVMPDDLSASATFRANLRRIGAAGLPFDLCVLARQLPLAADLARACDDQILVLDHCGVPDIAGGTFQTWAEGITRMGAFDHVRIKLSGITAYCAPDDWAASRLAPWVSHVLDTFGPARILWGSDWPVVNLGAGMADWIDMTRAFLAPLSAHEQQAIAQDTARATYRLDP